MSAHPISYASTSGRLVYKALSIFRPTILSGHAHVTDHAVERMLQRRLDIDDLFECVESGRICTVRHRDPWQITGAYVDTVAVVVVGARLPSDLWDFFSLIPSVITIFAADEFGELPALKVPLVELAELRP